MKRTSKSFRFVVALVLVISLSFPMSFNAFALTGGDGDGTSTSSTELEQPSGGSTDPGATGPDATAPPDQGDSTLDSSEFSGDFDSLPDSIKEAVKNMESTADTGATDKAATFAAPKLPELIIHSVEVVNGGKVQAENRDSVTYNEKEGKYYTSKRTASMTDARIFTVYSIFYPAQLGMKDFSKFDISKINWTYGNKAFSEWKQYKYVEDKDGDIVDEGFIGDQAISVLSQKHYTDGKVMLVVADIEFDEFYPEGWYSVNIPYKGYTAVKKQGFSTFAEDKQDMLGLHNLDMKYQYQSDSDAEAAAKPTTGTIARTSVDLNLYDSFHTWQEICKFVQDLSMNSGSDKQINERYVSVQSIAKSASNRDIWNIVIAKNDTAVKQYLEDTKPDMETKEGIETLLKQLDWEQS
ncbi:MAG: hypothetical protein AAGU75_17615, partial [Bacillota bacterium]